jgi:hypothetical protein
MLLFRSEEAVDQWCQARGRPRGGILDLGTLWAMAQDWFHDRMQPEWRRRTPEEAQALFTRLGLTGPFWQLLPAQQATIQPPTAS